MKKFRLILSLLALLCVVLLISCSKDKNDTADPPHIVFKKAFNSQDDEYFFITSHNGYAVAYYYNKLTGKVKFGVYDDKNEIYSNIVESKISCPPEKTASYGDIIKLVFGRFEFINYGNDNNSFLFYQPAYYKKSSNLLSEFNFYLFYNNGKVTLFDDNKSLIIEDIAGEGLFRPWYKNSFLFFNYTNYMIVLSDEGYYKYSGLSDTSTFDDLRTVPYTFYPLSYNECLIFCKDGAVARLNLTESIDKIWWKKWDFLGIENQPRIQYDFANLDGSILNVIINKTEYSGSKSQIKVKLNVGNGDYEIVN